MEKIANWYPSQEQIKDPVKLERTLRQILDLHYQVRDNVSELHKKVNTPITAGTRASEVPENTAAGSYILGLPVLPSDVTQLADGTKLTFVKGKRIFSFL